MLWPNLAQFFCHWLRDRIKNTIPNFVVYYFVRVCVWAPVYFCSSLRQWISFGWSLSVCVRKFKCRGGCCCCCCCCISVKMHAWCTLIRFDWIFRKRISGEIFTHAAMHLSRAQPFKLHTHTCFYHVNRDKFRSRVSCFTLHLMTVFFSRFI